MVHGKVIGSLLVVCLVAMLAEQTEGFLSFFSPSDMRRMMEKEKSKTGKKSVRSGETESGELAAPERYMEEEAAMLGTPLEIGVRLSSRQFDKYGAALGEVLNEMLEEGGKGEAYWENWERGLLSETASTGLKEVILVLGTG
ncbi:motilin-like [Acipenser ruthenus]|uniref:motilin-like n=1 Tax=Acipenser ruthenus TaxID=7906 RepID=UPI002741AC61|nr:motilin-like [Acipenser ruthenus]